MTDEPKAKKKSTKVSDKLAKIIEEIEKLSVVELAELVKSLEDKFGVSAMPMAAAPAPAAPTGETPAEEAQTGGKATATLVLTSAGANKIAVIKAVREINSQLGLKEAKDLVEAAPKEILADVDQEKANEAKKKLEGAGAQTELK